MKSPHIVIVGGVAAGLSAATRALRQNPGARVTVFERGAVPSYAACGLPYWLGGEIAEVERLVVRSPAQLRAGGIHLRLRHEVEGIDTGAATVTVRDLESGRSLREPYDRLLLAPGARAVRPPFAQTDLQGVHVLRSLADAQGIMDDLSGVSRVAIVGAGYIGLELAEQLTRCGLSVVVLEAAPAPGGRVVDPELRGLIAEAVTEGGAELRTGVTVTELLGSGRVSTVRTDAGDVRAGLVVVAVGVRPETELALAAGLRLGKTGAVAVNARQESSVPGIWAAGDVAEARHRVTGRRVWIPLGLTANRMGRVAGVNMAGGDARFPGVVGTGIFRVFGLGVARTGLTGEEAEALGLDAVSEDLASHDRAGYMPDDAPLRVRLTAEAGSGRLLGAQLLGRPESVMRVNAAAALLHRRNRIGDLSDMDFAYAPPFSPTFDPLIVAAERLARRL